MGSWKLVIEYYHMHIIDYMLEYIKYMFHSVTSLMNFQLFYIKPQSFQTLVETKMWTRWIIWADRSQMFPDFIGWSFPMQSVITMIYLYKPRNTSKLISLRTIFCLFVFKHYWVNWRLLQYNVYFLVIIPLQVDIPNSNCDFYTGCTVNGLCVNHRKSMAVSIKRPKFDMFKWSGWVWTSLQLHIYYSGLRGKTLAPWTSEQN